jgi:SAM-dependent methyltransferase
MQCGVCGGLRFTNQIVLWSELINEWQLSAAEAAYINRQQGETCDSCGCNLRSIALANALRAHLQTTSLLIALATSTRAQEVSILEINEAGMLSPYLRQFGKYVFAEYPAVDIHALPYGEGVFDVVIHSDTLEHVQNPVHALTECRRVLKPNGALCCTIPTVVGRLSRSRIGLPKSYHGDGKDDYFVHTEFGADAWTYFMEAGFSDVSICAVGYPAATAILARNGWGCAGELRV